MSSNTAPNHRLPGNNRRRTPRRGRNPRPLPEQDNDQSTPVVRLPLVSPVRPVAPVSMAIDANWKSPVDAATASLALRLREGPTPVRVQLPGSPTAKLVLPKTAEQAVDNTAPAGSPSTVDQGKAVDSTASDISSVPSPMATPTWTSHNIERPVQITPDCKLPPHLRVRVPLQDSEDIPTDAETPAPPDEAAAKNDPDASAEGEDASAECDPAEDNAEEHDEELVEELVEDEDAPLLRAAARAFDGQSHSCVIIKADGTGPLNGYHPTRVYRLGKSTTDGLTTRVVMSVGAFSPKAIEIIFDYQTNQRASPLARVDADFTGAGFEYHKFDTSSEAGLEALRILDTVKFTEKTPTIPKDLVKPWVPPEDKNFLNSDVVHNFETQVAVVTVTLPKAGISIVRNVSAESTDAATIKLLDDALAPYQNIPRERSGVAVTLLLAADDRWASDLNLAFEAGEHVEGSLVSAFCSGVKSIEYLDAGNVNIMGDDVPIPRRSMAARNNLHNNTQRTAILTAGVAQEAQYLELRSRVCDSLQSFAALVPVDGTQWLASTDDKKTYGIECHGQYEYFLAVVDSPEGSTDFLPDVGQDVVLSLRTEYNFREIPAIVLEEQDITKAVRSFISTFQTTVAEAKTFIDNERAVHHRQYLKANRRQRGNTRDADGAVMSGEDEDDDYEELSEEEINDRYLKFIIPRMAKLLLPYIPYSLTPEQKGDLRLEAARKAIAEADMATIHTQLDENPTVVTDRVQVWFNTHREVRAHTDDVTWIDIKWYGRRIPQLPGIISRYQFYYVRTPRHPNWPATYKAPPLEFTYDHPGDEGSAKDLHDRLSMQIPAHVFYDENVDALKHEGKALYKMNNLAHGSNAHQWFMFIINFNPDLAKDHKVDWFTSFPALNRYVAEGRFQGEHAVAAEHFHSVNFGKFLLCGGPGAGKSRVLETLVDAVLEGPTIINGVEVRSRVIYSLGINKLVDDAEAKFNARNSNRTSVRLYPWKRELAAILYEPTASTAMPRPDGKRHIAASTVRKHVRNCFEVDRATYSPSRHERSLSALCRARIIADPDRYGHISSAWQKYQDDLPAFNDEKAALKSAITELMQSMIMEVDAVYCTPHCVAELRNHCPEFTATLMALDEAGNLTETDALAAVAAYPEVYTIFGGDPQQWPPHVASHRSGFSYEADDGEKFVFHDLVSEQRRRPLLARAQGLQAVDFTLQDNHRVFGNAGFYMIYNLFDGKMRMANTEIKSPATQSVHEWLLTAWKVRENSLWVELADGEEVPVGTSYINEAEGNFLIEFVIQMSQECHFPHMSDYVAWKEGRLPADKVRLGTFCIGTMYAQQREWIRGKLAAIPAHVLDPARVDVRTIDQCLSHQADVFLFSVGRSVRSGHTKDIHRTNVALTRHSLLCVTVSSSKLTRVLPPNLAAYRQYHEQNRLLHENVKGWDRFCTKCCLHGHEGSKCRETPVCHICEGKHAARNCKRVPKSKILQDEMWSDNTKFTKWKLIRANAKADAATVEPCPPTTDSANAPPAETVVAAEDAEAPPAETVVAAEDAEAPPAETVVAAEDAEAPPAETVAAVNDAEAPPADGEVAEIPPKTEEEDVLRVARREGQDSFHRDLLIRQVGSGDKEKKPKAQSKPSTKERNENRRARLARDAVKPAPKPLTNVAVVKHAYKDKKGKGKMIADAGEEAVPEPSPGDNGWDNTTGEACAGEKSAGEASACDNTAGEASAWEKPAGEVPAWDNTAGVACGDFCITSDIAAEDSQAWQQFQAPTTVPGESQASGSTPWNGW